MIDHSKLPFTTGEYQKSRRAWPKVGKHILSIWTDETIIVYLSISGPDAKRAVELQSLAKCKSLQGKLNFILPTFLFEAFYAQWGNKVDEEHVLALTIKREGFEEILRESKNPEQREMSQPEVLLSWEEDKLPTGYDTERMTIHLGIRGKLFERFYTEWIEKIDDVTPFLRECEENVNDEAWNQLRVPEEKMYKFLDEELAKSIEVVVDYDGDFEEEEEVD